MGAERIRYIRWAGKGSSEDQQCFLCVKPEGGGNQIALVTRKKAVKGRFKEGNIKSAGSIFVKIRRLTGVEERRPRKKELANRKVEKEKKNCICSGGGKEA